MVPVETMAVIPSDTEMIPMAEIRLSHGKYFSEGL